MTKDFAFVRGEKSKSGISPNGAAEAHKQPPRRNVSVSLGESKRGPGHRKCTHMASTTL